MTVQVDSGAAVSRRRRDRHRDLPPAYGPARMMPLSSVRIEDVSRADAAATVVGEQVFTTDGAQVPLAYYVPYNTADIVDNHTYIVSGTHHRRGGQSDVYQ